MVYLVANGSSNLPAHSGITLTDPTEIGTVAYSSLGISPTNVTLTFDQTLAAGTYWIALTSASTTTAAAWERTSGTIFNLGVADPTLYNAHVAAPGGTALTSVTGNAFEMTLSGVDVPEPLSLAVFGTGLIGLGLGRRRRIKNSAG